MGHLDTLTLGGEQDGVITHHIPRPNRFETDFLAGSLAGEALTTIDGTLFQVTTEGIGDDSLRQALERLGANVITRSQR